MKLIDTFLKWGAGLVIERPVKKLTLAEMAAQFEASGMQLADRLLTVSDTFENRMQLRHIIGIERWGQRRLRVYLGDPFLPEEYDHYRPTEERSWDEIKTDFIAARQATVALIHEIDHTNGANNAIVSHNMYGPLSVKGWLRYLDMHATMEWKKLK